MRGSSKYGNFLTILLIIIIIAIVGLIGFLGYSVYQKYASEQEANKFVSNLDKNINPTDKDNNKNDNNNSNFVDDDPLSNVETIQTGGTSGKKKVMYQGFEVAGTIEIPTIKLAYPIIAEPSKSAIEKSVAVLYGPGPNQPGNTVIIGHNYRNGRFFSNNKKLSIGDKIYITDLTGKKLSYTIYDKFETTDTDTDYMVRNTNGAREISLQTCTDDGNYRLIILAKCDLDN